MSTPRYTDRFHGRLQGSQRPCAVPNCRDPGEFRAPNPYGRAPSPNGPGDYLWFCLDHVRKFNAEYDWFSGMTQDEIANAQSPLHTWPSETRAFNANSSVDMPPKWADFYDPLDAINARFKGRVEEARPAMTAGGQILTAEERRALKILGLNNDADPRAIRKAYSALVRKYHPDKNGGDRGFEKKLQAVVEAYQLLKSAASFM